MRIDFIYQFFRVEQTSPNRRKLSQLLAMHSSSRYLPSFACKPVETILGLCLCAKQPRKKYYAIQVGNRDPSNRGETEFGYIHCCTATVQFVQLCALSKYSNFSMHQLKWMGSCFTNTFSIFTCLICYVAVDCSPIHHTQCLPNFQNLVSLERKLGRLCKWNDIELPASGKITCTFIRFLTV